MTIDYTGAEGGRLAGAFASGCVTTWLFVRNMVMKPAIKSCHQRCSELEADREWLKRRVDTLETILMTYGNGDIKNAVQSAVSEIRMEMRGAVE